MAHCCVACGSCLQRKVKERNGELLTAPSHQELIGSALSELHARKSRALTADLSAFKERNPRLGEVRLQALGYGSGLPFSDSDGSDDDDDGGGGQAARGTEDGDAERARVRWAPTGLHMSEPGSQALSFAAGGRVSPHAKSPGHHNLASPSMLGGAAGLLSPRASAGTSSLRQRLQTGSGSGLSPVSPSRRASGGGAVDASLPSISRKLLQSSKSFTGGKASEDVAAMLRSPSFSMGTRKSKPWEVDASSGGFTCTTRQGLAGACATHARRPAALWRAPR